MTCCCCDPTDERLFRALTGTSREEFQTLLEVFTTSYHILREAEYQATKATRHRKPGGGAKGKLPTCEAKLFFVLYYWKNYPTYDVHGNHFHLDRSNACRNVHKLWPVLEHALNHLGMLPARAFPRLEDLQAAFADVSDLFIDATERAVVRSQDKERQQQQFSGKKHRHTVKNTLITTGGRTILFLGYTAVGSQHDYGLFKEEFPPEQPWFSLFKVWVDLGYLGIRKDYDALEIFIPHKTPRASKANPSPSLTAEQKAENRAQSRVRVVVEHAIGGMKRFGILVQAFRNRLPGFVDTVALLGAGLWNWKLACQQAHASTLSREEN
jgi:hypothetical protein